MTFSFNQAFSAFLSLIRQMCFIVRGLFHHSRSSAFYASRSKESEKCGTGCSDRLDSLVARLCFNGRSCSVRQYCEESSCIKSKKNTSITLFSFEHASEHVRISPCCFYFSAERSNILVLAPNFACRQGSLRLCK